MIKILKVFLLAFCLIFFTSCVEKKKLKTHTQQRNPYPYLNSVNTGRSVSLRFYNSQRYSVRIYWVDYRGNLVYYRSLSSGQSFSQRTSSRHSWVWMSYSNFPHGYYIANDLRNQNYRI